MQNTQSFTFVLLQMQQRKGNQFFVDTFALYLIYSCDMMKRGREEGT